ncbi:MAG: hypothetical protein IPH08_14770 [Rhodocyclaceae bacterium]|nr:hypothetical protein [Rhodocyclaceae bacterium]MBK6908266.1 hypothetical protein [Rhodocyclaceae bacterium]
MAAELWPNDDLTRLANHYRSDKGTETYCAHGYTRIYQALLEPFRHCPLRIAEIGLLHGRSQAEGADAIAHLGCPSLRMWADYLPNSSIHGFDIVDFSRFASERVRIACGDQGNRRELSRLVDLAEGAFDLIIDDGSHASHHQQITLGALFPALADGGLYIIEDLHFQPAELEMNGVTKTREFLAGLSRRGSGHRLALEQVEYNYLVTHIDSIRFFDSISPRWPITETADAFAVIRKRGLHPSFDGGGSVQAGSGS